MTKGRLEAFSDGVIAIIITIMVLELRIPEGHDLSVVRPLVPAFLSYVMSFVYIGIYWNNHHHLIHAVQHVNGRILWANLHLLFWLSLIPAATGWIGESHFAQWPVAVYGAVLFMAGTAYFILTLALVAEHGRESAIAKALGRDFKGKMSVVLYVVGIVISAWSAMIATLIYVSVALMWLVPDRRIERTLTHRG
jgi:uncharacterized membrane protein